MIPGIYKDILKAGGLNFRKSWRVAKVLRHPEEDISDYVNIPSSTKYGLDYAVQFDRNEANSHIYRGVPRGTQYVVSLCIRHGALQKDFELAIASFYFERSMVVINQIQGVNENKLLAPHEKHGPVEKYLPQDWDKILFEATDIWAKHAGLIGARVQPAHELKDYHTPA